MGVSFQGKNLIFIISQPRAGSTLLQRMLGGHPDIHTVSEPWLMLHPLYALRPDGYRAEYNERLAQIAVRNFLQTLPGGEKEYVEGVRRMYTFLYECALAGSGKRCFLDKTPRYYFIIPELFRTFPQARFLILLRNPLAVLTSMLKLWTGNGYWFSLYEFRHDLLQAPQLLLDGIKLLGERGTVIHFEQLVKQPEYEIQKLGERLGVNFVPSMVEYGHQDSARWRFGDPVGVYQHTRPDRKNANRWTQALGDPQVWRFANDYLQLLGRETIEQMGYPYEELRHILEAKRANRRRLRLTFPLSWLLEKPIQERGIGERYTARLKNSIQRRGIWNTGVTVAGRAAVMLFRRATKPRSITTSAPSPSQFLPTDSSDEAKR